MKIINWFKEKYQKASILRDMLMEKMFKKEMEKVNWKK